MKNIIRILSFVLFSIWAINADAQKFGYLNAQELLAGLEEVQAADKELEAYQKELLSKGQEMMQAFEQEYKQYMEEVNAGTLSKVQAQQKEAKLLQKQEELQKYEAEVQEKLALKRETLLKPIIDRVRQVIYDFGKENGYTMIFDTSSGFLLHASPGDNILEEIKKRL